MAKRKGLSKKIRYTVFKRDRFTCQMCGAVAPNVLMQVDHITPVAAGGSDDLWNLRTLCQPCNLGKSDDIPEEGTVPLITEDTIENLRERLEQAKAYMELIQTSTAVMDNQLQMVMDYWGKTFDAKPEKEEDGRTLWVIEHHRGNEVWPKDASVKGFLRKGLTIEDLQVAIDKAASWTEGEAGTHATRTFYKICHDTIRERSGEEDPDRLTQADLDAAADEGYVLGERDGKSRENERVKWVLLDHVGSGFATLQEAVDYLWPPDDPRNVIVKDLSELSDTEG